MNSMAGKIWVWCNGQSRSSGYWDDWGGPINGVQYRLKSTEDKTIAALAKALDKAIEAMEAAGNVTLSKTHEHSDNLWILHLNLKVVREDNAPRIAEAQEENQCQTPKPI